MSNINCQNKAKVIIKISKNIKKLKNLHIKKLYINTFVFFVIRIYVFIHIQRFHLDVINHLS